jgi:hypothetical protein
MLHYRTRLADEQRISSNVTPSERSHPPSPPLEQMEWTGLLGASAPSSAMVECNIEETFARQTGLIVCAIISKEQSPVAGRNPS